MMKQLLKHAGVGLLGLITLVYLLNPTAGLFEFLPDNIPIIGNIDEALATTILLGCLAYFGLDLRRWRHRRQAEREL